MLFRFFSSTLYRVEALPLSHRHIVEKSIPKFFRIRIEVIPSVLRHVRMSIAGLEPFERGAVDVILLELGGSDIGSDIVIAHSAFCWMLHTIYLVRYKLWVIVQCLRLLLSFVAISCGEATASNRVCARVERCVNCFSILRVGNACGTRLSSTGLLLVVVLVLAIVATTVSTPRL